MPPMTLPTVPRRCPVTTATSDSTSTCPGTSTKATAVSPWRCGCGPARSTPVWEPSRFSPPSSRNCGRPGPRCASWCGPTTVWGCPPSTRSVKPSGWTMSSATSAGLPGGDVAARAAGDRQGGNQPPRQPTAFRGHQPDGASGSDLPWAVHTAGGSAGATHWGDEEWFALRPVECVRLLRQCFPLAGACLGVRDRGAVPRSGGRGGGGGVCERGDVAAAVVESGSGGGDERAAGMAARVGDVALPGSVAAGAGGGGALRASTGSGRACWRGGGQLRVGNEGRRPTRPSACGVRAGSGKKGLAQLDQPRATAAVAPATEAAVIPEILCVGNVTRCAIRARPRLLRTGKRLTVFAGPDAPRGVAWSGSPQRPLPWTYPCLEPFLLARCPASSCCWPAPRPLGHTTSG